MIEMNADPQPLKHYVSEGPFDPYSVEVVSPEQEKLYLASRNLPYVEVLEVTALNPLALASYDKVLMTVAAVKRIEERLQ